MGQTLINFRIDEEMKKEMESACKEMGLSLTTAFTIFAIKVGRERRIPFEVSVERREAFSRKGIGYERGGEMADDIRGGLDEELIRMREQLESACGEIRRSLTNLHISIPASRTGLTIEKIRLLCGDELKDKTAETLNGIKRILSDRNLMVMREKDIGVLEDYADALSHIRSEVRNVEFTLIPALKSSAEEKTVGCEGFEARLSAVSKAFDGLQEIMNAFLRSTARMKGTASSLQGQIQRAGAGICDPEVKSAIERLEMLILQQFDALPVRTRGHLETHYYHTLVLTLEELEKAERSGEDASDRASLCLRVIHVMEQTIEEGRRAKDIFDKQTLTAEVVALERIAAMRGNIPDGLVPKE